MILGGGVNDGARKQESEKQADKVFWGRKEVQQCLSLSVNPELTQPQLENSVFRFLNS